MGIFGRVSDIFKSNVNEMLDRMEDPEKMVKQMIVEMEEALTKATSALAKAMANEQNLRRQQGLALAEARSWEEKAALAVRGGSTDLAKAALSKKVMYDGQAAQYDSMVTQAAGTTSQLRAQLDGLKAKLEEARMKQATLSARAQAAKTQKEFTTVLGTNVGEGAFAKFGKLEKKIEGMEAESRAFAELSGEGPAEDPFKTMEKDLQVEAEMARLLEKMNKGGVTGA